MALQTFKPTSPGRRSMVRVSTAGLYKGGPLDSTLSISYFTYNQLYWGGNMSRLNSVSEKLDSGGGYFFDPDNVNYTNGEISRGASLALWATDRVSSPLKRVLGYGPGASKSGSVLGNGEIARRFAPLFVPKLLLDEGLGAARSGAGTSAARPWARTARPAGSSLGRSLAECTAMSAPCSPTGETQPRITSSTVEGSRRPYHPACPVNQRTPSASNAAVFRLALRPGRSKRYGRPFSWPAFAIKAASPIISMCWSRA